MSILTRDLLASQAARHGWAIGDHSYGAPVVQLWGVDGALSIGRYCSFGGDVRIMLGGNHRTDWLTTYPFSALWPQGAAIPGHPATRGPVAIGNDVWFGQGSTIVSGVTIGDGAVIAAEAVVVASVPPYTIMGGNPARPLRRRFTDAQIAALLEIAWWNWPDAQVAECVPRLLSGDVAGFIAHARTLAPLLQRPPAAAFTAMWG